MKTSNAFVIYFHLLFSNREILTDVYRADVTFFLSHRRDGLLFSLVLLFCAVLLVTVLLLFQKAAINNTLISKASL